VIGAFNSDNPLTIVRHSRKGCLLNGSITSDLGVRSQENEVTPLWSSSYLPFSGWIGIDSSVSKAISRTNPSRAVVPLLSFLGELKDLPRMIRHAGRYLNGSAYKHGDNFLSAAKEVASEHLAISFGWAPLINDLVTMAQFAESFERRKNELNRLYSGSGLKRRVNISKSEGSDTKSGYLKTSQGLYIHSTWSRHTQWKSWAVVRWKPISDVRYDPDSFEFTKVLLGLRPEAVLEAAWELLPWSWLIDYFTNVGELVSITNNSLGAAVTGGTFMWETEQTLSHPPKAWTFDSPGLAGQISIGHSVNKYVTKNRVPFQQSDLGLNGSFSLLSGKQLSILNSIAMLRV
jgi:hypothetical protein